jgi:hypothetical protein
MMRVRQDPHSSDSLPKHSSTSFPRLALSSSSLSERALASAASAWEEERAMEEGLASNVDVQRSEVRELRVYIRLVRSKP